LALVLRRIRSTARYVLRRIFLRFENDAYWLNAQAKSHGVTFV
jgi:hypothetical protein